jgi:hypothetical protein
MAKKRRNNWRQMTVLLTREQFIKLDGIAFSEGIGPAVKARNLIADALDVPRNTVSDTILKDILDKV